MDVVILVTIILWCGMIWWKTADILETLRGIKDILKKGGK